MKRIGVCIMVFLLLSALVACSDKSGNESTSGALQSDSEGLQTEEAPSQTPSSTVGSTNEENGMNEIEYTTPSGETGYVYVSDTVLSKPDTKVPMVLMMCATGSEARHDAQATGWVDKALEENMILLAPNYNNYATYSQVDAIVSAVDYITETYPVDTTRVYSTGFSNGGATSVALCSEYPQLFAAISALGWMVDLQCGAETYADYDMPFQVIQGTEEYTQTTAGGAMAVMDDEQRAIRSLLLFNEMIDESTQPDYDATPYWGYVPDASRSIAPDGRVWTVDDYYKEGYAAPFAQLVLIDGASHRANEQEAAVTWDFIKNFSRSANGSVIEHINEQED